MAVPRNAWLWGFSYAMLWLTVSVAAGTGPGALARILGRTDWTGLYFAVFLVVAAVGALLGGRAMATWGRRPVLMSAHLVGAAGYVSLGWADAHSDARVFGLGLLALAFAFGTGNLTRAVGAELFGPESRAKGVAFLQAMAAIGAFVGPAVLILGGLAKQPLSIAWTAAPVALVLAAGAVALTARAAPNGPAPAAAKLGWRALAPATMVLILAQVAMMAPMSVAGAALLHLGHGPTGIGLALMLHFAGMFALAPIVGRVADKRGRLAALWSGVAMLAVGGLLISLLPGWWGYSLGLLAVGLGWCFAFVTCTVVVADLAPPAARPKLLGRIDVLVSIAASGVSLAAGAVLARSGAPGLGLVVVAAAVLAGLALGGFARRQQTLTPKTA